MNIVNKLTLRHLRENRSRTVITIAGIIVSVAMITAVFVSLASILNLYGELSLLSDGDWHVWFENVTQEQLGALRRDDRIAEVGCTVDIDGEDSFQLLQRVSDRIGTGDIYAGDKTHLSQIFTVDYDGVCPEDETEIAVEQSFIDKNGLDWKLGDTVEVMLGSRYLTEDGEEMHIRGSWRSGETFRASRTDTFHITAILHDNPATGGAKLVRGLSEEEKNGFTDVTVQLKKVNSGSLKELEQIVKDYGLTEYSYHRDYFNSRLAFNENNTVVMSMLPLVLMILALIIIASVCLIYNAFAMSLSERVRYLGMLASVGATKKQKRRSVYFEGLVLGAVSVPLGLAAGVIGISVTLKIVAQRMVTSGMLNYPEESNMVFRTVVPWWSIVGIIVFSALTIFISAFIPARRASKITPIDALRRTKEYKLKAKKLKCPRYIRALFGYEGELAYKNLKRNGRKARVITASIALSVVLFLCVNYFCTLFMQANDMSAEPYQVSVGVIYEEKDRLLQEMEQTDGVDRVYSIAYLQIYESAQDSEEAQALFDPDTRTAGYEKAFDENSVKVCMLLVDDADFDALCEKNGLNKDDYYGDELKGVVLNSLSKNGKGAGAFNEKLLGLQVSIDPSDESAEKVTLAAFAEYDGDSYLCKLAWNGYMTVYLPQSVAYERSLKDAEGFEGTDYRMNAMFGIETKQHEKVAEEMERLIEEGGYTRAYCVDTYAQAESMNATLFVVQVFVYGFIVLITLITVANIMNTISTGILLRRREFAMLKSVGITPGGFQKMISYESLLYGLRALIVSIPLSLLLSYIMNVQAGDYLIPFSVNVPLYLAVVVVVFAIIGLTMVFAVAKLSKDSVVETLKEEIL